ncbi:hypothetical protein [Auritidibacter ignavus]|uniref:Uncharacterized protein n=1 Tax=Auritidibacter ignavus TaxID=678932 RepID=A0AAJ6AQ86_9MICC|nr:hypothetical protein [Auritidibacter ignavus]NIH72219.1 hypothetical protein [Auritidibacter ignavus]RMX23764.1 hypothetical protein DYI20_02810 [Auritidibacter ignavus]WGH87089.1 hypothetical protein QDX24_04640 [Auritidibacter ignavus]WGH89373.1 hypothetical protein QDX22_04635 [Auritidibacter ignavus]WGH94165.1 hypothetical protein QDX21_05065 [Auritidibacter ignavus]
MVWPFPRSWFITVKVERGGGGLDRFGRPLPVEEFEVTNCLLGPKSMNNEDQYGAWSDSDAALYHETQMFQQNDLIIVGDGLMNAGRWEVQAPSNQWPFGTETILRRVNQHGEGV